MFLDIFAAQDNKMIHLEGELREAKKVAIEEQKELQSKLKDALKQAATKRATLMNNAW